MGIPSYRLLGVQINPLAIPDLHTVIKQTVKSNQHCIIASRNLHSVYIYHHDPKMREFSKQAQYMRIDGMPLVLFGKLLGYPLRWEHRVTFVDWVYPLMAEAMQQNWRVFYLGSKPGIAKRGAEILCQQYPGLQIMTAHGYFDPKPGSDENQKVLDAINAYQPNVLMVGMGMPRQEHWIIDNIQSIDANVILPCGACIDYIAGAIPTPPRWMGRLGLEWFSRLMSEPGRLWERYLLEPWFVINLFLRDVWIQGLQRR